MWHVNLAITQLFDLLLIPFKSLHPLWPLLAFSLLTGILMLTIFRYTSNQKGIKHVKNLMKAHLLELRLFKDDLSILLSAQKSILFYNASYIKYALKPMLFMIVPVAIILIQLDGWFGYRPLRLGESAVVSVILSDNNVDALSNISIDSGKGLAVETPPLRITDLKEVDWRIRAIDPGVHELVLKIANNEIRKKVIVSNGELYRISPIISSSLLDTFLNPTKEPIENSTIRRVEVYYPSRLIEIFGWKIHWIVGFLVLSILFGYALKGFFRVEV